MLSHTEAPSSAAPLPGDDPQGVAQIAQEKANPNALAQRVLFPILYGADHSYGKPASGYERSVQAITREDLMPGAGSSS